MSAHGRYTILRKVADGGTAEVFLARQHGAQGFEKLVVLKRILTTFYADPLFRNMLVDEAHIAMSLAHGNIVQVLDLGESGGRYFLALELVDGWTLDQLLLRARTASFPLPQELALWIAAGICRALACAHGKAQDGRPLGIVHRDVSPHNILISEDGEVKLTDFGIAKAQVKRDQSTGNVVKGKIAFMSPEQAEGKAVDARSDLFSLGTCLYEATTGKRPFEGATDYETLLLVRECKFTAPQVVKAGINPWVARTIRQAMKKEPGERYQQAEAMLADIERTLRTSFRPVGQTELKMWLRDLGQRDKVPPLTRVEASPAEPAENETVVLGSADGAREPKAVVGAAPGAAAPADPTAELDVGDVLGTPPPFSIEAPTVPESAAVAAPLQSSESRRLPPPLPPLPPRAAPRRLSRRAMVAALGGLLVVGGAAFALSRGGAKAPPVPPLPPPAPARAQLEATADKGAPGSPPPAAGAAAQAAATPVAALPAAPVGAAPAAPAPTGAIEAGSTASAPPAGSPAAAAAAPEATADEESGDRRQRRQRRHARQARKVAAESTDKKAAPARPPAGKDRAVDKKSDRSGDKASKAPEKKKGQFFIPFD